MPSIQGDAMPQAIAGLVIPDSPLARAAHAFARGIESDLLFNHSHRVFAFAALSGVRHAMPVDLELLYVGALFHRVGLTGAHRHSVQRFEVDGANAARTFLRAHGVAEEAVQEVWDAIALHTTPGIGCHKTALVALLECGVAADTLGFQLEEFSAEHLQQVLRAFPRELHFKQRLIEALASGMRHRPETTFGTVNADILERVDPTYRRLNLCGLILGSDWAD
jgi:HD domain